MQHYTVYFIWKLLYMFRVVPPPIIRSAKNCIYSIWYLSRRYCYLPLSWTSWNCLFYLETALHVSGSTATHHQERKQLYLQHLVFDGWWYHPKHVEHFPDKINCVTLHLLGYILEYTYAARTHER